MIDICESCNNVADIKKGLCCICRMKKEIDESKGVKVAETIMKGARKIAMVKKESAMVVKEEE